VRAGEARAHPGVAAPPRVAMTRLLLVCLGGALGTALRYGASLLAPHAPGPRFPYATLAVNLAGSFLIAVVMVVATSTTRISPDARVVLTAGVMGGLTTYSTFNYETLAFAQRGAWSLLAANVGATLLGCALAGVLGLVCGRWLAGA
jgi:CrcB protein